MTARETLRKLAPLIGEARVKRLWRAYLSANATDRRELENSLEAYAAQLLNDNPAANETGQFPPPPPEKCLGDIDLGKAAYCGKEMCLFGLRSQELLRHVGIYGSSGSGKSNAIALILDSLIQQETPFLLVDFKRTFRALLKDHPNLWVFTGGDAKTAAFRMNPLIPPPGSTPQVWLRKVTSALSHGFMQGAGSESLLITAMSTAYEQAAQEERWPTFEDVAIALETVPARGRKGMWLDSAKRAVTSLTEGNAKDAFCHPDSLDPALLLRQSVVLELDLLNQAEQTFLSEILLLWIIQYRMNQHGPREELRHVILIEEAHHLLRTPPGVGDGSEPVIHTALREVRELGESVILATQNASVVPVSVFGNQATTLAFHTKHASDVRATAQAMLLKDECKDELGRLPVGEAIGRIPRWTEPVRIRLDYRPIAKGTVTDACIREHMRYRAYSTDTRLSHFLQPKPSVSSAIPIADDKQLEATESREPSTQVPTNSDVVTTPSTTPKKEEKDSICKPSDLELAMLKDIVQHPFDGVVKRINRLATSRRKGTAALRALEARQIVKPASLYTGTSMLNLYDITREGRSVTCALKLGLLPDPTAGGIEHRYWVRHCANTLRSKGWSVQTEHRVSDHLTVDVHAELNGHIVAVLVETGKSNAAMNIRKTAEAGYNEIWVVTNNPEVTKLKHQLTGDLAIPGLIAFKQPNQL